MHPFEQVLPRSTIVVWPNNTRNITLVVTDNYDPTPEISFYRPFRYALARQGNALVVLTHAHLMRLRAQHPHKNLRDILSDIFAGYTIAALVLCRYTGEFWPDMFELAQKFSSPVAVHLDDNLLEVPIELGQSIYDGYKHPTRVMALREGVKQADLVISSTKALAEQLKVYSHRKMTWGHVYCSSLREDLRSFAYKDDESISLGYMASASHRHDLEYVVHGVARIMRLFPHVTLEIFGFDWAHPATDYFKDRIKLHKPVRGSYVGFRRYQDSLAWDIGLAPLRRIHYNRCKANTKWVECSAAGAAVVAADFDPYWTVPADTVALSDDRGWFDQLADLVEDRDLRRHRVEAAQNYIKKNLMIKHHANQLAAQFALAGAHLKWSAR